MIRRMNRRKRITKRTRRDSYPDFAKLVWMAKRRGEKGRAAMQVLQDALMIHWGVHFEKAIDSALRKEGSEKPNVAFSNAIAKAILNKEHKYHTSSGGERPLGPFYVVYSKTPRITNDIIVWVGGKIFERKSGLSFRRFKRTNRPPPGPASGFGKEKTIKDIKARIRWETWAGNRALKEEYAIYTQHVLTRVRYEELLQNMIELKRAKKKNKRGE